VTELHNMISSKLQGK